MKRFWRRKKKTPGRPHHEPKRPVFLFDVNAEKPCDLCGDATAVNPRIANEVVVWVCTDASACSARRYQRSLEEHRDAVSE